MPSEDQEAQNLSPEDAAEGKQALWSRRHYAARLDQHVKGAPASGSSLNGDDRAAAGWGVSSSALFSLSTSIEHLKAVQWIIADAKKLAPTSLFTLARTAIEAGAATVWLLAPPTRADRVRRRLKQVRTDWQDEESAYKSWGITERVDPLAPEAKIWTVSQSGPSEHPSSGTVKIGQMIKQAANYIDSPTDVHSTWQVCSGLSHGRFWAYRGALAGEIGRRNENSGMAILTVKTSLPMVLWAAGSAYYCVEKGMSLYEQRASRHY